MAHANAPLQELGRLRSILATVTNLLPSLWERMVRDTSGDNPAMRSRSRNGQRLMARNTKAPDWRESRALATGLRRSVAGQGFEPWKA